VATDPNKVLAVPDPILRAWAVNLRNARKRAGYGTQAQFADALGCTRAAVNAWERGIRAPSPSFRIRIGKLLGRDPARLFPYAA
jgi:transcriptional regulator with XRE-family HTH domain